jgi:hypothetical protein
MYKAIFLFTFLLSCCIGTSFGQNYARFSDIKAGMSNPYLEHHAIITANKRAAAMKCRESFSDAKIVSDAWEMFGTSYDEVAGRLIHMELYGETPDGKCGVSHCVFLQKVLEDGTYAHKLKIVELGNFYSMQCE